MIPDLPEGISADKVLDFYSKLAGNLQDQSTIHVNWHTHRRNPSVCWICDLNIMISKLITLSDSFITKSTVDLETELLSESETDTEIEGEFLNRNDEPNLDLVLPDNEPEYDIE